jgi:CheY-like chemotaxis protein
MRVTGNRRPRHCDATPLACLKGYDLPGAAPDRGKLPHLVSLAIHLSLSCHEFNQRTNNALDSLATLSCAGGRKDHADMNLSRLPKNLVVLVAEADPMARRRLETISSTLAATVRIVTDGEEALDYLSGHAPFFTRDLYPFPDLLVFNLQMPRMNGLELLRWVAHESDCAALPKVVLDCVRSSRDVQQAYFLGANTVFVRPDFTDDLRETMRIITGYWARAELPFVRHC